MAALHSLRHSMQGKHAAVVVLGDVGRSPRMQYHALSLLDEGAATVSLVGYRGEALVPALTGHPRAADALRPQLFTPFEWPALKRACWPAFAIVKALALCVQLFAALFLLRGRLHVILVQNPPALPILPVAWLVSVLRGAALVIDWHNLGFTMLAMALGKEPTSKSPPVRVCKALEGWCARRAQGHMCVTRAMKAYLAREMGVTSVVLHDRPPSFFCATDVASRHELFARLADEFAPAVALSGAVLGEGQTLFTEELPDGGGVRLREARPALLISSTRWGRGGATAAPVGGGVLSLSPRATSLLCPSRCAAAPPFPRPTEPTTQPPNQPAGPKMRILDCCSTRSSRSSAGTRSSRSRWWWSRARVRRRPCI